MTSGALIDQHGQTGEDLIAKARGDRALLLQLSQVRSQGWIGNVCAVLSAQIQQHALSEQVLNLEGGKNDLLWCERGLWGDRRGRFLTLPPGERC